MNKLRPGRRKLAKRIVACVELEVNDRRGIKWSCLDKEILTELRGSLVDQIVAVLAESEAK